MRAGNYLASRMQAGDLSITVQLFTTSSAHVDMSKLHTYDKLGEFKVR